jgi:spermidine synthase
MPVFGATILLSAFLLFLVQPIIAKQILPWFGGGSSVWTVCQVFFELVLLAGYAYADATSRWLKANHQAMLHLGLLGASLLALSIIPDPVLEPAPTGDAAVAILRLLAITIGLKFFLLSSTGPLLQRWLAHRFAERRVYRLFALSNVGSLVGLLAFPFFIEPHAGATTQSHAWSAAYGGFALLCAREAWQARGRPQDGAGPGALDAQAAPITAADLCLWIALAALGSALLLAVTSHITQNVASVPFLWILPLALYLLSFIVAFGGRGLYRPRAGTLAALLLAVLMAAGLAAKNGVLDLALALPLYYAGLFAGCLYCHGELALRRPAPRHLTRFYLTLAAGGALGGIQVGLVAPRVFWFTAELPVALFALCALALLTITGDRGAWSASASGWSRAALFGCAVASAILTAYFGFRYRNFMQHDVIAAERNFYGTLRVRETGTGEYRMRRLLHGVILHGEQPVGTARSLVPGSYYGASSGVGLAIAARQRQTAAVRLGVVGLGVGTLSAYGRPADQVRFYELDPDVVGIARRYFSYLEQARAPVEIVLGDARLSLARELAAGARPAFDVLAIDAFSSDSIPVHLITVEAVALYVRAIAADGIIAVHVSNRFLDLAPVLANIAQALDLQARLVYDEPGAAASLATTDWVLLARSSAPFEAPPLAGRAQALAAGAAGTHALWTDRFNDLLDVVRFDPRARLQALLDDLTLRSMRH